MGSRFANREGGRCASLRSALWGLAAFLAAGACGGGPAQPARARSALIVTLDTTRADALGCYGGRSSVTPSLDELARESVLYTDARTTAPLTVPAHASIFTGLYPPRHTVRDNALMALPPEAVTLAERAQAAGFKTMAFVACTVLDNGFGLAQGFNAYLQPRRPTHATAIEIPEKPALQVAPAVAKWLRERDPSRPFLVWVHLFDPHMPYKPPQEFLERSGGDPYLGEVAAVDAAVGEILRALREERLLSETLVVVVGDHGEGRNEHGEATHSTLCYDSTLRVPFLIRYPDGWRAGERSAERVSVVDVYPTVVEALGLGDPGAVDGVSLFGRRAPEERGVYFESLDGYFAYGWAPLVGWLDAEGKVLWSGEAEVYDPVADPREERDLAAAAPDRVAAARERIRAVLDLPALSPTRGSLDPSMVAELRGLGYAGAGDSEAPLPDPLEASGRPSPRTRLTELGKVYQAVQRGSGGDVDGAIALLQAVVGDNPRNSTALDLLGMFLVQAGRHAEAVDVLRRQVALGPPVATVHDNLGHALEALGDSAGALEQFATAVRLDRTDPHALEDYCRLLEAAGRTAEAAEAREQFERRLRPAGR